jgi:hypothetical protein
MNRFPSMEVTNLSNTPIAGGLLCAKYHADATTNIQ